MRDPDIVDVLIVGAGPAGAFLAHLLASSGVSVRLIDRMGFPRYRACGGGLTERAVRLLPFDLSAVIESRAHTPEIRIGSLPVFDETLNHPVIHMVMRDRFDAFLAEKAVQAGAVFEDRTAFLDLAGPPGDLRAATDRGVIRTRFIVAADGVHSRVGRCLGLSVRRKLMTALEAELFFRSADRLKDFTGTAHFDFGVIPGGYGWIFPKSDHLSVGILTRRRPADGLKDRLSRYMNDKGLISMGIRRLSIRGRLIPYGPHPDVILADSRGLLAGDAAGFTDPITGEGIYFALKGASVAASVLSGILHGNGGRLSDYTARMKAEMMPELTKAEWVARVFYGFPRINRLFLSTYGETAARHYIDIIRERKTFREFYRHLFHPFQIGAVAAALIRRRLSSRRRQEKPYENRSISTGKIFRGP